MPNWKILCDFDGTIAVDDVTDLLLQRFAKPGWDAIEDEWRRGRIGSRDCMAAQIALLDADAVEIDALLDTVEIDPAFPAFVAAVRSAGIELEVVSDGVDHAIHRILARFGLDDLPVVSNQLQSTGPRSWRLAFPHAEGGCTAGTCKCARDARVRTKRQRVLLIGDGRSDFCVANRADLVLARGALIQHCRVNGICHLPMGGFAEALARLPDIKTRLDANPRRSINLGTPTNA